MKAQSRISGSMLSPIRPQDSWCQFTRVESYKHNSCITGFLEGYFILAFFCMVLFLRIS